MDKEDYKRLQEIQTEMQDLLEEAANLVRMNGSKHDFERAKAYWIGYIDNALAGAKSPLLPCTIGDTIKALRPIEDEMQASELQFSLHTGEEAQEDANSIIICLCPISYWKEYEYLPEDSIFAENITMNPPKGYEVLTLREEMCWVTEGKTMDEVRSDMLALGMTENLEQQKFMNECWR